MERWRINLYIIWFSQIISLMSFGFGIPFLPFYIQQLGISDPDQLKIYTGILSAAPAISMGLMAPVWGYLADRYGKKLMLMRSMLFGIFILAGMGLATRPEHLVILRIAQGMFTGTVTASSALIASNTPNERLSYALGFLSSSTFIGFSLGPVIGGFIAEYVGYRISFYIGAVLLVLDLILVFFAANEGTNPTPEKHEEKQEAFTLKQLLPPLILGMLLVLLFIRIARTVFAPYMPLYVQELRAQLEGAAGTTGVISGITGFMTALAGLTLSRMGDRLNKNNLLIVLIISSIVVSLPLTFIHSLWLFTVVYGLLFFTIGGIEPIVMSVTSQKTPAERRGVLFGIQALVGSMGWAISPLLGTIISIRYSLQTVFIVIPIVLVFALAAVFFIKKLGEKETDLAL